MLKTATVAPMTVGGGCVMAGQRIEPTVAAQEEEEEVRRRLGDPKVRRRIEELQARVREGRPEGPGMTASDLLDLAREQQ
jgi:hypothetical protein